VQRRALGLLFASLAAVLGAITLWAALGAGHDVRRWIVAFAALALAGWLASLALSVFRRHR
jgi:hypothetical protein